MPRSLQQRELRHLPSQAGAHPLQQRGQEHQVSWWHSKPVMRRSGSGIIVQFVSRVVDPDPHGSAVI
jgi:hypothetical protein